MPEINNISNWSNGASIAPVEVLIEHRTEKQSLPQWGRYAKRRKFGCSLKCYFHRSITSLPSFNTSCSIFCVFWERYLRQLWDQLFSSSPMIHIPFHLSTLALVTRWKSVFTSTLFFEPCPKVDLDDVIWRYSTTIILETANISIPLWIWSRKTANQSDSTQPNDYETRFGSENLWLKLGVSV